MYYLLLDRDFLLPMKSGGNPAGLYIEPNRCAMAARVIARRFSF